MSVESELASINVTLDTISVDVSSLKRTVNGNGQVGLVGRMAMLEQADKSRNTQRVAIIALCGTFITALAGLLVAFL